MSYHSLCVIKTPTPHLPFSALSNHSNTLTVPRPGDVLYSPAQGLELILQDVFFLGCIPDPDFAMLIY